MSDNYIENYFNCVNQICKKISKDSLVKIIKIIKDIKNNNGRIFFLGVGGSAGNASHAVNDFRKILGIECYAPTDNISELTARVNDEGWDTVFSEWLKVSNLSHNDLVFIFSVGGGDLEKKVSTNIVEALKYAKKVKTKIVGIVGRNGGYTSKVADEALIIPTVDANLVTPLSESFQALIWHLIVSSPDLAGKSTKWESIDK